MKILVYSSVFYPSVGGIENLSLVLIEQFMAAGHEVKVVTEQKQDTQKPSKPFEIVEYKNIIGQLRLFFWSDIVFMPNVTLKGVWLFFLNPFKKLYISHNDFHLAYHKKWLAWLKIQFIKTANVNIAVSKSVADFMDIDCKVIYNCYDGEVFKLYPDEKRDKDFVFVGRLVSYKGCIVLIEAFAKLKGNYTLTIIGDGPEMPIVTELVKKYKLEENVRFSGFMHGEELARALNQHKIMVIPPIEVEGFGIVALEGLACGCDMIVSDAGGLSEAIGSFGSIFPMRDASALSILMDIAINNDQKNVFSHLKQKYLEEHSKFNVAKEYMEVFENDN